MNTEWPEFRVFAIRDGQAFGLLVKRQQSQQEAEEAKVLLVACRRWACAHTRNHRSLLQMSPAFAFGV